MRAYRVHICICLVLALAACGKESISYYQGGELPKYRRSSDGRYYPVDGQGRFREMNLAYREQYNDRLYTLPAQEEEDDPFAPTTPLSMHYPTPEPQKVVPRGQTALPMLPAGDNDAHYSMPISPEQRERELAAEKGRIPNEVEVAPVLPAHFDNDAHYYIPPEYEIVDDHNDYDYPIYFQHY